jgi:hypothetical protein
VTALSSPDHLPPTIQQLGAHEGAMESGRSLDDTTQDIERQMILSALMAPGSLRPAPLGPSK